MDKIAVDEYIIMLDSRKISERRKACVHFLTSFNNAETETIRCLNKSNYWDTFLKAVQNCLLKDADKSIENMQKKGLNIGQDIGKNVAGDVFLLVMRFGLQKRSKLNIHEIFGYIIGCMRTAKMKKCYEKFFLVGLKNAILKLNFNRSQLVVGEWQELLELLKQLFEEPPSGIQELDIIHVKCFKLFIKYAPVSGFSLELLREQVPFIISVIKTVNKRRPTVIQEDILEIAMDFCLHCAKDSRDACCRLGEATFSNLTNLYELDGRQNKLKEKLIEYILLQLTIHHPGGAKKGHPDSHAADWPTWTKCLLKIYSILTREIDFFQHSSYKNVSFFRNENNIFYLLDNFKILYVNVSYQLYEIDDLHVSNGSFSLPCTASSEVPAAKRLKIDEITFGDLKRNALMGKDWVWISLLNCMLKLHSDNMLINEDYVQLVQTLTGIIVDSQDVNLKIHAYKCLRIIYNGKELKYWNKIGKFAVLFLNQFQNDDTNLLVQKLVLTPDLVDINVVLQIILGLTVANNSTIKTMLTVASVANFSKINAAQVIIVIKWMLDQDVKYLLLEDSVKLIGCLCFEQWPFPIKMPDNDIGEIPFQEIADMYLTVQLKLNKLKIETPCDQSETTIPIDHFVVTELLNILQDKNCNMLSIKEILHFTDFLLNLIDFMITHKIIQKDTILLSLIQTNMDKLETCLMQINMNNLKDIEDINILYRIFGHRNNKFLITLIKNFVSVDLLKVFFKLLNDIQDMKNTRLLTPLMENTRKALIKVMSAYSFITPNDELNENQNNILDAILNSDDQFQNDDNFAMVLLILQHLKDANDKFLNVQLAKNILNIIQNMCITRFEIDEYAVQILRIIKYYYGHLANLSRDMQETSVMLLSPFYQQVSGYGPGVALEILECVEVLCQIDPQGTFSQWEDIEIISIVPEFLSNDYVEVRLKAVEVLVKVFNAGLESEKDVQKQEMIFNSIYVVSERILNKSSLPGNEQDDRLNRNSSVLITYYNLMVNCDIWMEESLLALMKLIHHAHLNSVDKVIDLVCETVYKNLSYEKFMETHVTYMLEKWLMQGLKLDLVPFDLFRCQEKKHFYLKYIDLCVPLLISEDKQDLVDAAQSLGVSAKTLIEKALPKILVKVITAEIDGLSLEKVRSNKTIIQLSSVIKHAELQENLKDNLDQIVLNIINLVTDDKDMHERLGQSLMIVNKQLSFGQFLRCLDCVKDFLDLPDGVIEYLLEEKLDKLERILLRLKVMTGRCSTVKDVLRTLHHYAIVTSLIEKNLTPNSQFLMFFIEDTCHFLMIILKKTPDLVIKYVYDFLLNVLLRFSEAFDGVLVLIVNTVKVLMVTNQQMERTCFNILNLIVIDNAITLSQSLAKLDLFPDTPAFQNMNNILKGVKFDGKAVSLQDEIKMFLDLTNEDFNNDRENSLNELHKKLSSHKDQLEKLYEDLKNLRGFSEDCKESVLHRLVATLIKMTKSPNEKVSNEAIKCLGELGPANLYTLILEPEKTIERVNFTGFEMVCAKTAQLLSKYIMDADTDVMEAAADVLYVVVSCKETRKIINNKQFLRPFILPNVPNTSTSVIINNDLFISTMSNTEIWCPRGDDSNQADWIINLTIGILEVFSDKSFLPKLTRVCRLKAEMCEELLPILIFLLLHGKNGNVNEVIVKNMNFFFEQHWKWAVAGLKEYAIVADRRAVKCMLDVVQFVRIQKAYAETKKINSLNVNYQYVAQACQYCDKHFAALFYAESWCYNLLSELEEKNKQQTMPINYTKLDTIYQTMDPEMAKATHAIYRNAYKSIGDQDALSGCGITFILEPEFRLESYKETNQWDRVAHFYSMRLYRDPNICKNELMNSFKMCRLYEVPLLFSSSKMDEAEYECLWRLGQWAWDGSVKRNDKTIVEQHKFFTLKAIHDKEGYNFGKHLHLQSICLKETLRSTNLECSKNIYPILMQLQSLVEASDFFNAPSDITPVIQKWTLQDALTETNDFEYLEPIMAQRIVMSRRYLESNRCDLLTEMMLKFADVARNEQHFRVATRVIGDLLNVPNLDHVMKAKIDLSQAQLYWALNDKLAAMHILNKFARNENENPSIRARALKLSGQYMAETNSENGQTIISEYFLKSLKDLSNVDDSKEKFMNMVDTIDQLASFADRKYQQIINLMKSDMFERKVSNMKKSIEAARKIQEQREKSDDERRAAVIHERQSRIDEIEIENTKNERDSFLQLAMQYYLRNLHLSDKNNISIFRVMALFLENRSNPSIKEIITSHLKNVASYKYIDMLPQLVPHISDTANDLFTSAIGNIVENCSIEHPHHTLPLLISLANANKDREYTSSQTVTSSNDSRVTAANKILDKLKSNKKTSKLITKMNILALALIELAYYEVIEKSNRAKNCNIPTSLQIAKIKNFDDVLLPTVTISVSKTNRYDGGKFVGIHSFGNKFQNVGGINAPKCIVCRGTDGLNRSQLVKGKDDLRQDSVMQQVFTIMNNLFATSKQTLDLRIRTYKVVPLSMRSGILEWVDNSMPFGEYLVGNKGAHYSFRPRDLSPSDCRNQYKKGVGQSPEMKLKIFNNICSKFKPVFHKFFEETFLHPTVWYERRRAYIFSVATSSMCGYILGIGDRHVNNILIDKNTAEFIHIDFGVAFEQGRCLPTPETVPFRLTRDMVDGMGISGVEGIFRKSCEKTMEVLRLNAQTILTILEVLLYDPLYSWSVTPAEANKRQTDDLDEDQPCAGFSNESDRIELNITAQRALLRLRNKLQGTEEGSQISIEHQVGSLIQQAMDPSNLCRLFYGWQPYL